MCICVWCIDNVGDCSMVNSFSRIIFDYIIHHPHVLVDNIYGKVFNNHKAWTMDGKYVEMAPSITFPLLSLLFLYFFTPHSFSFFPLFFLFLFPFSFFIPFLFFYYPIYFLYFYFKFRNTLTTPKKHCRDKDKTHCIF
jgi:hypothetical protein